MTIIAPSTLAALNNLKKALSVHGFYSLNKTIDHKELELSMPKFSIKTTEDLVEPLKSVLSFRSIIRVMEKKYFLYHSRRMNCR